MKSKNIETIICKYFTGVKDMRYGDFQTLRPVRTQIESRPGLYRVEMRKGFANITFEDKFLIDYIVDLSVSTAVPIVPEPFHAEIGADLYRAYVFSNYVHGLWKIKEAAAAYCPIPEEQRRLFVMAMFLAESIKTKGPQFACEPFAELYDTFSKLLYNYLASIIIMEADAGLRALTAAALILRAFREA